MAKYRKKPAVIDAVQWTGNNLREVIDLIGLHESVQHMDWEDYEDLVKRKGLKIFTLEGSLTADIGDYIIKGIHSEPYPCKPDIFAESYDVI